MGVTGTDEGKKPAQEVGEAPERDEKSTRETRPRTEAPLKQTRYSGCRHASQSGMPIKSEAFRTEDSGTSHWWHYLALFQL
jgi:hypothetical protein